MGLAGRLRGLDERVLGRFGPPSPAVVRNALVGQTGLAVLILVLAGITRSAWLAALSGPVFVTVIVGIGYYRSMPSAR